MGFLFYFPLFSVSEMVIPNAEMRCTETVKIYFIPRYSTFTLWTLSKSIQVVATLNSVNPFSDSKIPPLQDSQI